MLKYEDNLWGKTEFLHNKYKTNCSYYKDIIELIEKIEKAYKTFSEIINSLFNKKSYFIEDPTSSIFLLFQSFQCHMKSQSQEFHDLCDLISNNILEPYKNQKIANDKTEENLFKELSDLNKALKKSKNKLDENKNNFYNKLKEVEKLILEEKSTKINELTINQGKKDKINLTYNSIVDGTLEEQKYNNSLEETNQIIQNINLKEKKLLNFYQTIEEKRLNTIKDNIYLLITGVKTSFSTIVSDVENVNQKIIDSKIDKDMNLFIEKNKSNLTPMKQIKYIPYTPFSTLDDSLKNISENEKMNINYEVLADLQKSFPKICMNYDLAVEKKRKEFRLLCQRIFEDNSLLFSKEDLDTLINFLKSDDEYRKYFLSTLTNQRINGKFKIDEKLFNELVIILNLILDLGQKKDDFNNAKNCIILSQTFYKEIIVDENIEKKYLMEEIKKNKWVSSITFWKNYIEYEIIEDKLKFDELNIKKNEFRRGGEANNIYFSKIITHTNNMHLFGISKNDIINVADYLVKKYEIPENLKEMVFNNIELVFKKKEVKKEVKKEIKKDNNNDINNIQNKIKKDEKKLLDDWVIEDFKNNNIEIENNKKNDKKKDIKNLFKKIYHKKNEKNYINEENNSKIKGKKILNHENNIINEKEEIKNNIISDDDF